MRAKTVKTNFFIAFAWYIKTFARSAYAAVIAYFIDAFHEYIDDFICLPFQIAVEFIALGSMNDDTYMIYFVFTAATEFYTNDTFASVIGVERIRRTLL